MTQSLPSQQITRIREGSHDDLPAIARLIGRANSVDRIPRIGPTELEAVAARGQLIVLELQPCELAAAACIASGRGLVFLVIDPELATPELEHRMIAVADALCEAQLAMFRESSTGVDRGRIDRHSRRTANHDLLPGRPRAHGPTRHSDAHRR